MSWTGTVAQVAPSAPAPFGTATLEVSRFSVPVPPHGVVRRPRLEEKLDDGVQRRFTLVSAPAGAGKTTLVATWASGLTVSRPVVWISVDDRWVIPDDLWQLMLAHHEPVVLVLDCDRALPTEVAAKLDWIIGRSCEQVRVVLITREDPPLPLHRYRLEGSVVEVRNVDLAFTTTEARELLISTGIDLSTAAMDAVTCRTQGWAAGLRLAAISLAHRADREDAARKLAGDVGIVAEYLLAEVLNTHGESVRSLLLETSVVDVLRPGLASALAGPHAERALSFLVHGNVFLEEIPDLPGCYRYHSLFRELLCAQLAYESPGRSVELHRIAADWLADQGMVVDAVQHSITTGDWERAARYVVDDLSLVSVLLPCPSDPLNDALAMIPPSADGIAISIVGAAQAMAAGDPERATSEICSVRRMLATAMPPAPWPAAELALTVLESIHARRVGDVEAIVEAAVAAQRLMRRQASRQLVSHPEVAAVIQSNFGAALVLAGRLDEAYEAFSAAANVGQLAGREYALIDPLAQGALLAALRGDLRTSVDLALRAIHANAAAGLDGAGCPKAAEVALAYVEAERYNISGARRHLARAADCRSASDPLSTAMLALSNARIRRAEGSLNGALSTLAAVDAGECLPPWLADRLGLEQIALLLADGQTALAAEVAQDLTGPSSRDEGLLLAGAWRVERADAAPPTQPLAVAARTLIERVNTLLRQALGHAGAGNERRAVRDLEHALQLAAPEQLRRPFRQAPEKLQHLLRQHDEVKSRHMWLTERQASTVHGALLRPRAQSGSAMAAKDQPAQILQPLTDREREVLGHLAELLTTEEISTVMYISVNTVRTHVRNILRKLACSRRNEAIRRARDMKIIPN